MDLAPITTSDRKMLRIGIVGCGTAGQCAAILFARAGHHVSVIERASHLGPIGAGLLLQPSVWGVLEELGVLSSVMSCAAPVRRLLGTSRSGRAVLDVKYADLDAAFMGLGVQRGMLFDMLQRAMLAASADLITGFDAQRIELSPEGRPYVGDGGVRKLGPFDLVVIADGARSGLRRALPGLRRNAVYPWGCLWFMADDPEGTFGDVLRQFYDGTSCMVGFLPSGRLTLEAPKRVSMFWSLASRDLDATRREGVARLGARVLRLAPQAAAILNQLKDMDQLIYAAYRDVTLRPVWCDQVVAIGDAAHAMSPQLGQGANLALLDAACLAGSVSRHRSVGDALAAYARERAGATRYYQFASRWLTPVFQSDHEWIGLARDALMGPMSKVPWVRRQMLLSLAGMKHGFFG